jgi:hypothetical protein
MADRFAAAGWVFACGKFPVSEPGDQELLEEVTMAVRLVLGAVAEQGNGPSFGEFLQEAQGKLLAMVFDRMIAAVNRATFEQFVAVPPAEIGPGDFSGQHGAKQRFGGAEISHPDMVTGGAQAASAEAGGEDAETIFGTLDRAEDGFGFDHKRWIRMRLVFTGTSKSTKT